MLQDEVNVVLHSAATIRFDEPLKLAHPNTYTFTKALAENIVLREASDLPTAIVRPSMGWLDNVSGITGLIIEMARGTLRSIFCDKTKRANLIPVDVVVNAILAVAAHLHWYSLSEIPVYNVTSAGITWEDLKLNIMKTARHSPSKYVQWYPNVEYTTCLFLHRTYDALLHYVPAFVLDLVMKVQGQKPMFIMDLSQIQWDKYINTMILGIRQYILKDDFSSLPGAPCCGENVS
ncbi:hypothetical protein B566_EDAN018586 [Ephemera danica]|nr:hypothetical protein B566_EDAN018586 [Ephemera danica]